MSWKFKLTPEEYTSLIESFSQLEMFEKYTPNYEKHTQHTPRIVEDSYRAKSALMARQLVRQDDLTLDARGTSITVSSLSDEEFSRLYLQPANSSKKLKLRGTKANIEPWRESQFNREFRKEYKRRKEREDAKERKKSPSQSWSWETSNTEMDFPRLKEISSTWIRANG